MAGTKVVYIQVGRRQIEELCRSTALQENCNEYGVCWHGNPGQPGSYVMKFDVRFGSKHLVFHTEDCDPETEDAAAGE